MNFQKFNHFVMYILIISIFLMSCKKNTTPTHYTISQEIKQFYLFQAGSYWIYQNGQTLQIDSMYISRGPVFSQKNFVLDDGTISSITDQYGIVYESMVFHSCEIEPGFVTFGFGDNPLFIAFDSNIQIGQKLTVDDKVFEYLNHFDSLSINNQYFHDVRKTRYSFPMNPNGTDTLAINFVFARYIGLIQTSIVKSNIDTTWNLIRYHVVQ